MSSNKMKSVSFERAVDLAVPSHSQSHQMPLTAIFQGSGLHIRDISFDKDDCGIGPQRLKHH